MRYIPKDAPFKTSPKSREGLISVIQRFSPKSAKRFFFEVGILGFGKKCATCQLFLWLASLSHKGEEGKRRGRGGKKWGRRIGRVELDLAERIQGVTFWRLASIKNLIFEPFKVTKNNSGRLQAREGERREGGRERRRSKELERGWAGKKWGTRIGRAKVDLAERIQGVTFWRLASIKKLIFEPLKVCIYRVGRLVQSWPPCYPLVRTVRHLLSPRPYRI